jgi:CheY-like chemotaxis protein
VKPMPEISRIAPILSEKERISNVSMLTILYGDDDPLLRDLTRRFLERKDGDQVDLAEDGDDGLKRSSMRPYDIIISDYKMPEKDGITFLKEIRALGSSVPFILFTGRGRENIAISTLNNGVDFYPRKGLTHSSYHCLQRRFTIITFRYGMNNIRM